jgi:hypothetical protein
MVKSAQVGTIGSQKIKNITHLNFSSAETSCKKRAIGIITIIPPIEFATFESVNMVERAIENGILAKQKKHATKKNLIDLIVVYPSSSSGCGNSSFLPKQNPVIITAEITANMAWNKK